MSISQFPKFVREHYELHEWRHATSILHADFGSEWADLIDLLTRFRIRREWLVVGGGRKSEVAGFIDDFFESKEWEEKSFETTITVDGQSRESPTHKVDCYRNKIALEIEWNNKDPFFDRDLNNFRLLFELRSISVGIIITRSDELQSLFKDLGIGSKYGASTTHMSKLLPRIEGGGGGGCPILVVGIKRSLYQE